MSNLKLATIIISIALLAGCAMGNEGAIEYSRNTSIGQELIDLKAARDQQALTEEEYQQAKADLLKQLSLLPEMAEKVSD